MKVASYFPLEVFYSMMEEKNEDNLCPSRVKFLVPIIGGE